MQGVNVIDSYLKARLAFFKWRSKLAVAQKLLLACGMACATGLLAQVKFYLPWTPVPVVASQLGVILAAALLGKRWGGISMLIYALGGFAGIPWFAGFKGGTAALFGPTGGYIIGFVLAAFFMGHLIDTHVNSRKLLPLLAMILFAQLVIVYIPGLIQLGLWLAFVQGEAVSLTGLLWMGFTPFIIGDIAKSVIGTLLIKGIIPMEDYSRGK